MTDLHTVVLVCEKPNLARLFLEAYARNVPEKPWQTRALYAVTAGGYQSAYRFDFPRGHTISDYPLIREPVWRNHGNFNQSAWRYEADPDCPDDRRVCRTRERVGSLIGDADHIVFAGDWGISDFARFDTLMRVETGQDRDHRFAEAITINDTSPATVGRAVRSPLRIVADENLILNPAHEHERIRAETATVERLIDQGRMRRFIEYNFRLNAYPLWGQALRDAGLDTGGWMISRWMVQLVYALRGAPPLRASQIRSLMDGWRGHDGLRHRYGLGSPLHRSQGLDDVIARGLLVRTDESDPAATDPRYPWIREPTRLERDAPRYVLSARALALLARLHPDTEDRDLPKRIAAWEQAGSAARPAVERYIRTVFGKQKRFFKRHFI